ncbi:MAG: hypothetical protein J2P25_05215 [Nocardiopsaceae bacterium]|nr:hypothetical protein [Nocardiopsaceae bacterium]
MSFTERMILWMHVGTAVFTIGPLTVAIWSTPRYIRKGDAILVGYLHRVTQASTVVSLLAFVLGLILASIRQDFGKPWVAVSMTLFMIALVLLTLIIRDQTSALAALRARSAAPDLAPQPSPVARRIAILAGIVSLIWLITLLLMT